MNIFLKKTGGTAVALAMSAVASMAQASTFVNAWNYSHHYRISSEDCNTFECLYRSGLAHKSSTPIKFLGVTPLSAMSSVIGQ